MEKLSNFRRRTLPLVAGSVLASQSCTDARPPQEKITSFTRHFLGLCASKLDRASEKIEKGDCTKPEDAGQLEPFGTVYSINCSLGLFSGSLELDIMAHDEENEEDNNEMLSYRGIRSNSPGSTRGFSGVLFSSTSPDDNERKISMIRFNTSDAGEHGGKYTCESTDRDELKCTGEGPLWKKIAKGRRQVKIDVEDVYGAATNCARAIEDIIPIETSTKPSFFRNGVRGK